MWKVIIDNREKELEPKCEHIKQQLEIGDIIIEYDQKPEVIIERKSEEDFYQSWRDGRFREQRTRLLSSNARWIFYLIEDSPKSNIGKFPPDFLKQNMIHIQLKYNIKLIWSKDIDESSRLIDLIFNKARLIYQNSKDTDTSHTSHTSLSVDHSYAGCVSVKKKHNLTPKICFLLQLEQIPGISKTIAAAIVKIYPTWKILMEQLITKTAEENKTTLGNIQITDKRKLGPKAADKILEFLGMVPSDHLFI